jgi:hypothetical protein
MRWRIKPSHSSNNLAEETMLANLSSTFHKLSSKTWLILLAFAVEIFFFTQLAPAMQAQLAAGPLDLKPFYTPDQAFVAIESYSPEARAAYRAFELTADIVHPIAYVLFYGLLMSVLLQRAFPSASAFQKFNIAPAVSWVFDMIENICIITMLSVYPSKPALVAWISGISTSLKWAFFAATMIMILVSLVKAALNGFKRQM